MLAAIYIGKWFKQFIDVLKSQHDNSILEVRHASGYLYKQTLM